MLADALYAIALPDPHPTGRRNLSRYGALRSQQADSTIATRHESLDLVLDQSVPKPTTEFYGREPATTPAITARLPRARVANRAAMLRAMHSLEAVAGPQAPMPRAHRRRLPAHTYG